MKLPKAARLRRRREFLAVQERGGRLYSGEVLVLFRGVVAGRPRIGITVSSKVANAVGRNRFKRWVREAFRELQEELPPVELVVIARSGALALGLDGIRKALAVAARKLAAMPRPAAPAPASGATP